MRYFALLMLFLTLPTLAWAGYLDSVATGNWSDINTWRLRISDNVADTGTTTTVLKAADNTNNFLHAGVKVGDTVVVGANSSTVASVDSATQLTLSPALSGLTSGATFTIRRVPGDGDKIRIRSTDVVTIDQNIGTVAGGGIKGIQISDRFDVSPTLKYDGTIATASYTIVFGSTSNAVGSEIGTVSAWTYTAAGTPASTPGVTVTDKSERIQTENWKITCTTGGTGTTSRWKLEATVSFDQFATDLAPGTSYLVDPGNGCCSGWEQFSLKISDPGAVGYTVGDTFTASSTAPTFVGLFNANGFSKGQLSLIGTATRTLTMRPVTEDTTLNWYIKSGTYGGGGNTSGVFRLAFLTLRYLGSANHVESSYEGLVVSNGLTSSVSIVDSNFVALGQLLLQFTDNPTFSRNTLTNPQSAAVWRARDLITSSMNGPVTQGTFDSNTLNDSVGRTKAFFLHISSGSLTTVGGIISNNVMAPTGTDTTKPWFGMQVGSGTTGARLQIFNNNFRPLAAGTLSIPIPGDPGSIYAFDSQNAWITMYGNTFAGFMLTEFEQNTNGTIYKNKFLDGYASGNIFVKRTDTRLDFYDNIIRTTRGEGISFGGGEGNADVRFYNNTVMVSGSNTGVSFVGGSTGATHWQFYNNVIRSLTFDATSVGLDDAGPAGAFRNIFDVPVNYNVVSNFNTGWQSNGNSTGWGTHPAANESTGNPNFTSTDPASADFAKLSSGSSALNIGNATADVSAIVGDFYGNPRIVGAAVDAGAVEAPLAQAGAFFILF